MRTCAHEGCTTRLSAYNAYETCYNHTFAWSARKIASAKRTRVKASPAASVLAEVPAPEQAAPAKPGSGFRESSRIAS